MCYRKHDTDAGHPVPADCTRQAAKNHSFNRCGRWVASPPHLSAVDPAFRSLWGSETRQLILILHRLCLRERWVTMPLFCCPRTEKWLFLEKLSAWARSVMPDMCPYMRIFIIFLTLRLLLNTSSCYFFNCVIYRPRQFLRSVLDSRISMEHWWSDTCNGKPNCLEKDLSQCHFVLHKSYISWYGIELSPPRWDAGVQPPEPWQSLLLLLLLTLLLLDSHLLHWCVAAAVADYYYYYYYYLPGVTPFFSDL